MRLLSILAVVACLLGHAIAQDSLPRVAPYPPEAVAAFERLPVQDGGRIKPLDTLARFMLLRISERRYVRIPDEPRFGQIAGSRLEPTEWAMDVMLFPEQADEYPAFLIPDRDLLDVIGAGDVARKKRDRYSFRELASAIPALDARARAHFHTEEKNRTRQQNQLVHLHQDLVDYQGLRGALDAARTRVPVPQASAQLRDVFGNGTVEVRYSTAARHAHDLLAAYRTLSRSEPGTGEARAAFDAEVAALDEFLSALLDVSRSSSKLAWLPPADPQVETWLDSRRVFAEFLSDDVEHHAAQIEAIEALEAVVDARDDVPAMAAAASTWVDRVTAMAAARGEGRKLIAEVAFYRHDHFWRAQWCFVAGVVAVLLSFLLQRFRTPYRVAWAVTAIGAALVVWGVTERCILRERPPVSTLYETILLVSGSGVLVAMILEIVVLLSRARAARGVALGIAALAGSLGMFLAASHETFKGEDTMPQLQAVLDTNFWLSTHVTTVTLGYMAGLLAGLLAHVWLIGKAVGWKRHHPDGRSFYRWIGRMIYALLCFTVLLSTIGTILGGVWANDSWGRFWGWDPKENGALMIVLWNVLILHGRLGGFWRDGGTAVLAVFGNVIIAFSWWGVNLMGVGLHSYGFQSGVKFWVSAFYVSQLAVGLLGWRVAYCERHAAMTTQAEAGADAAIASDARR